MYVAILTIHSWIRWLVLISLLFSIYRFCSGWLQCKTFTSFDDNLRKATVTIAHIQFLAGISLYTISPLTQYFLHHFDTAVKQREIRFFGMEHVSMMIVAITIITIGSSVSKKRSLDRQKFKTLAITFTIGLLLILANIPWQFSPLVSRPYFRTF